jgi:predicted dehydrogenase
MSSNGPVGVGLIGAGQISEQYLTYLSQYPDVRVLVIGDLDTDRAREQATKYGVKASGDVATVLNHPGVEIVVNLTIPAAHVEVSSAAIRAGKHVWSEKPIGIDRASSKGLVDLAATHKLLLGIAPDTVLGSVWQGAKRAIQGGLIGTPLTALTAFQSQGPERFHSNPAFLFAKGAGPLFDMGPYYLSALVSMLGPISEVVAVGTKAAERRTVQIGPMAGETFSVEVPTHVSAACTFAAGQSSSSLLSSDTALKREGIFEINGTEGTLVLGDPNYFGGWPLKLYRPLEPLQDDDAQIAELIPDDGPLYGRGVGVLTMARTVRGANLHVATGELGYHVLDAIVSIEESIARGERVGVESTVGPIAALPADFDPYQATL